MNIYDNKGNITHKAVVTEGAVHEQALSRTPIIRLTWKATQYKPITAGSYVVFNNLKYYLLDPYYPSESKECFKYTPVFNHPLACLSRTPFLYQEKGISSQQEWSFKGLTSRALQYVCDAINAALFITDKDKLFTFTLSGTVPATVSFQITANDILSSLSIIAKAAGSEWHLSWDKHVLYFGQIYINYKEEPPALSVYDNIQIPNITDSKRPFYNCFYPQGSTKNMSTKAMHGTGNVATLERLTLDKNTYTDGCIYTDTKGDIITKDEFKKQGLNRQTLALSFNDIYPHVDLYVYNVRKRVLPFNTKGQQQQGKTQKTPKKYTVWYMRLAYPSTVKDEKKKLVNTTRDKDGTVTYWYDYLIVPTEQILQGYKLRGIFKVNEHTKDNNEYNTLPQTLVGQPHAQDGFEFYYHTRAQSIMPNTVEDVNKYGTLQIEAGDYEIVYYQDKNIIIPSNEEDGLIPRGNKLPDFTCNTVVLYNIKLGKPEILTAQQQLEKQTIKEIKSRFLDSNNYTFHSNPIAFKKHNPELYIGQRVNLDHGADYQLKTRVLKLVTKLDAPCQQEITVGNQTIKGAISELKENVTDILAGNFAAVGINAAQLDAALTNYTKTRFLRKDTADTAADFITFLRGLIAKQTSYFDAINTKDLTVTGKATFFELEILKAKAAGGIVIQSAATFKIDYVEDTKDGYVCYQRAEQDGVKLIQQCEQSDQMLCYGGMNVNEHSKVSNHFFWCLVTAAPKATIKKQFDTVSREYLQLTLSKTDHATGSDAPQVGDVMMLVGNRTNTDRQSVNISSVYKSIDKGLKPPYWAKYTGVNNYDLSSHRETYFSRGDNQIIGNLSAKSPSGVIKPVVVFLGRWNADTSYGYYDSVTHNGRQWLCIIEKGKKTQDEPGTTDAWQIIVDKGDKGDSPIMVNILSSTGNIMRNGQGEVTLTAIVTQDGEDITDKYPQAAFSWTRTSSNPEYDVQWNKRHRAAGKTITIKAEDVWKKAQFEVILNN